MIIAFAREHKIGSICRFPCAQCEDDPEDPEAGQMSDQTGESIGRHPLYIVREATVGEYLEWCRETNSIPPYIWMHPNDHYYEVTTD